MYTIEKQTLKAGGFDWKPQIKLASKRAAQELIREFGAKRVRTGVWMLETTSAVHFYRIVQA
jgi:hypothetical protein